MTVVTTQPESTSNVSGTVDAHCIVGLGLTKQKPRGIYKFYTIPQVQMQMRDDNSASVEVGT